ncbi:alpha/beta hydrolase fold-domain-containing protein [Plectosphaerella plurivora]|uniref:Alpha/beta hydrolase fold-domain-containing protein n=1 Tax=Plectosphaerella plurivora TaxID=936078 RepID=A0A9P9AAI3_9PEZI|nr:alpha/beta hydrolase fold-domain-containing protein [Plectosphaerella plurivora]
MATTTANTDTQMAGDTAQHWMLFKAILPHLPLMVRVAVSHVLRLSEQSKYLDLRSELIVSVLRAFLQPDAPKSISWTQRFANRDPGIKGRLWVSKYATPVPPENDVLDALVSAVNGLQDQDMSLVDMRWLETRAVEAEWTGYRAAATPESVLPSISERERYDEMQKEVSNPLTVLYFHGGAYYLLDPCTYRPLMKKLAKLTGGRCYSVRYRLAPQNPFPSAVLDALVAYLTLLYPPPDAYHEAVQPEHIVFAGDSAGGNLSLALVQTLLELRRQGRKIAWYGEERELPMPAGVGINSPWMDILQSSPSCVGNGKYDYLPSVDKQRAAVFPSCEIWPASPPRGQIYAEDALLAHPLATLLMARDWTGAPPTYICTGWELLADEDKYIAQKLQSQGVKVVFEEYEGMPHCFAILLTDIPAARRNYSQWTGFLKQAAEAPDLIESRAMTVKAKTLEEVELHFSGLSNVAEEDIRAQVLEQVAVASLQPEAAAKL